MRRRNPPLGALAPASLWRRYAKHSGIWARSSSPTVPAPDTRRRTLAALLHYEPKRGSAGAVQGFAALTPSARFGKVLRRDKGGNLAANLRVNLSDNLRNYGLLLAAISA